VTNLTRRGLLKGSATTAIGLSLPMPFISRGYAASGKIVVGMEAGSPYDTYYRSRAQAFTDATGVTAEFQAIPHDNIRQQFVQERWRGAARSTSISPTRSGCPSSTRRASSRT